VSAESGGISDTPGDDRSPVLRVHIEGEDAVLGRVPAADVAELLRSVERAVARAASVVVGRPSRSPGRREQIVSDASRLILRAVESGSVEAVLELPRVAEDLADQGKLDLRVAQIGEVAVTQLAAVVSGEIDGHPYVVEALSQMADSLQIGVRYDAITLDLRDSHVSPVKATIDAVVRKRLSERVTEDKTAAREGMVVGTLVEADFESFTARLRGAMGQAVTVSFDPTMADAIQEALREPTTMEGWLTYDPGTQEARSITIRTVRLADQLVLGMEASGFWRRRGFTELQQEQGITGVFDIDDLHDATTSEEELDAYEAALHQLREA
jgi:hypothetical protein